jgi:hypothetical protein
MKRPDHKATLIRRPLARAIVALTAALGGSFALAQAAADHDFKALGQADQFWTYFDEYCTECHNFDDYFGGVDFTTAFPTDVAENAELYEKVVKKLNGRMMPPPNRIRPDEARTDAFVAWLESYLDEAAAGRESVQHVAVHRLNRKEYANAIRDLFGIEIKPEELLPADDTSDGFDNIAEALKVSPAFINQYVSAARVITEQVVGDPTPNLGGTFYENPEILPTRAEGGGSQQFHVEGLPLGTRGGMVVDHWFPVDGEYSVSVGDFNLFAWMYNIEFENTMIVTVDGKEVYRTILGGDKDRIALDLDQGPPMDDINARTKDIRFTVSSGPHKVGVTYLRRSFAESDDRLQHFIPGSVQDRILPIPSIDIRGPYNAGAISNTPTRDKLFTCYPQSEAEQAACAEEILSNVATRAYRRPLTDEDLQPLLAFYEQGAAEAGFEEGIRRGLTRALASPNFLYRAEVPGTTSDNESTFALSSVDLASRLSFFLWSSVPDDELLEVAFTDQLQDPGVLEAQIRRMLADPRSSALAENFASQWLHLGKLSEITPDPVLFPYAAGAGDLRPDFQQEIALFIDSIFREDQSVLRLLDASHTYLNERIALHYGIKDVRGNKFRRVELDDPARHGLLGKGGVLMATAYPNRTSPVLRGAWILETIMGTPPPVPPPDVEDLAENVAGKPATSVRERLERHRENPTCNSCHSVMDPLGFALDNFDATGRWRDLDRDTGMPIDPSGIMPNGSTVNGPIELRTALLSRPNLFAQAITEKLMIYALGRSLVPQDMPTVRALVREAAENDYRFSSIVLGIVNTEQFRKNRSEVSGGASSNGIAMGEPN